ncbi:TPA: hypothetical protein HL483_06885 [Escherichia coli]|nr:hypothetical protein [Escherichia coli]
MNNSLFRVNNSLFRVNNSLFRVNNNDPPLINCYWEYVEVSIYAGINQYIFYGHSFLFIGL